MESKQYAKVDGKIVGFDQACQYLDIGPAALHYRLANFTKCYVNGHLVERVTENEINDLVEKIRQANINNTNNTNNTNEKIENMKTIKSENKRNKQLICEQTGETVGTVKEFSEVNNKTATYLYACLSIKGKYTDRDTNRTYVYEDKFDGVIKPLNKKVRKKWDLINSATGEHVGNLNDVARLYTTPIKGNNYYTLDMYRDLDTKKKWVAPDGIVYVDATVYNNQEQLSNALELDGKATIVLPNDYTSRTMYCIETKEFFKNMNTVCDVINKKWYIVSRALRLKGQYVDPDTNRTYVVYCKWIKNQNKPTVDVETQVAFNVTPKKEILEKKTNKIVTEEDKDIVKKMIVDLFDKNELDTLNKVIESYKRINKN